MNGSLTASVKVISGSPGQPLMCSLTLQIRFISSKISYKQNHTVYSIIWLLQNRIFLRVICVAVCISSLIFIAEYRRWWLQPWNKKMLTPWKESYDQPRQYIKNLRHYFVNKGPSSQGYGFPSGHVWMWELDYKESWVPKNWCFWTVVLENTLESPLDCKEIQPVHSKGDQSWVFIGRTDVEAETPILWLLDAKSWLIWCWERLRAGGEGDNRGQDGWMASLTQWTWVWVDSRSWWWTGRPGVLRFMGSQRVGHDWATELTDWVYHWMNIPQQLSTHLLTSIQISSTLEAVTKKAAMSFCVQACGFQLPWVNTSKYIFWITW